MQLVFQDPHASLNPAMDILTAVGHPLVIHGVTKDPADPKRSRRGCPRGRDGREQTNLGLLNGIQNEEPDESFWTGVRAMDGDGGATVAFNEPIDPELVRAGRVEVACHLYDERALEGAERARASAEKPRPARFRQAGGGRP